MKQRSWFCFLLITFFFSGFSRGYAQDDWSKNNRFSLFGDFVFLQRSNNGSGCLVQDTAKDVSQQKIILPNGTEVCCNTPEVCCPPANYCVLNNKQLTDCFGYEPGFRVGIGVLLDRDICNCPYYYGIELSYMNLAEWSATKCRSGDGTLNFPFKNAPALSNFVGANFAKMDYTSKYQDVELNYLGWVTPPREDYFSYAGILGFRYINLKESFDESFSKNVLGACQTSSYSVETHNNLFGVQLGGDLQWNPLCNLTWDFKAKVAGLANSASQSTYLGDFNNCCVLRDYSADTWQGSILTDLSLSMIYLINSHVMIDIGYQFLCLFNAALAPQQIINTYGCECKQCVYDKGTIFMNGGFAGLKIGF